MTTKDFEVAKKFKSLVAKEVEVKEVKVFGSRARGDATEESDLDIFVVVDHLNNLIDRYISDCAWEAGFPEDILVMPIAITLDALINSPLSESVFIKNVYKEGISI